MILRALLLSVMLLGCPTATKTTTEAGACAKVGESCELSPGKLGTCVQNDDTCPSSAPCFTCQSQH